MGHGNLVPTVRRETHGHAATTDPRHGDVSTATYVKQKGYLLDSLYSLEPRQTSLREQAQGLQGPRVNDSTTVSHATPLAPGIRNSSHQARLHMSQRA